MLLGRSSSFIPSQLRPSSSHTHHRKRSSMASSSGMPLPINTSRMTNNKQSSAVRVLLTLTGIAALLLIIRSILPHGDFGHKPIAGMEYQTKRAKTPILVPDLDKYDALVSDRFGVVDSATPQSFVVPNSICPKVVIVTDIDYERYSKEHLQRILKNRIDYAQKHGYGVFSQWTTDYRFKYQDSLEYKSWTGLAMVRAAMHAFPNADYFHLIDSNSAIMNHDFKVENLLDTDELEKLMMREQPILKSSHIIKTISSVHAAETRLIMTQNDVGMSAQSFILANDANSKSLLDFWTDRLYRMYKPFMNHDHPPSDAINHLLQWHHSYLRKLAIIPTKKLASLVGSQDSELAYTKGDFIAIVPDCTANKTTCEQSFQQQLINV